MVRAVAEGREMQQLGRAVVVQAQLSGAGDQHHALVDVVQGGVQHGEPMGQLLRAESVGGPADVAAQGDGPGQPEGGDESHAQQDARDLGGHRYVQFGDAVPHADDADHLGPGGIRGQDGDQGAEGEAGGSGGHRVHLAPAGQDR
ncbi:hypothetical protein ACFFX0_06595 [Citricoccus parietis]|uniref:Uncharacterized protein n=1 Tax=Citricoccus parietis TaxID=592307 RepID=A0ABV5FW15_9MICC